MPLQVDDGSWETLDDYEDGLRKNSEKETGMVMRLERGRKLL